MADDQLDATSARPLFDQLAARLRAAISSGRIPPDHKIESQEALADRLGISRTTARRALEILQSEGWVVRSAGKGLYSAPADAIARLKR